MLKNKKWKNNLTDLAFNQQDDDEFNLSLDLINALRTKDVEAFKKIDFNKISTRIVVSWIINTNNFNFATENGFDWIKKYGDDKVPPIFYLSENEFKLLYGSYADPRDDQIKFSYKKLWNGINEDIVNNFFKSTDMVSFYNNFNKDFETLSLINYSALKHSNFLFLINKTEEEKNSAMFYFIKSFESIFRYDNDSINENKIIEIYNELKTDSFKIKSSFECIDVLNKLNSTFLYKIRKSDYNEIIINQLYLDLLYECVDYIKGDVKTFFMFIEGLNYNSLPEFTVNLILEKIKEDTSYEETFDIVENLIKYIIDNDLDLDVLEAIKLNFDDFNNKDDLISNDIMQNLCTHIASKINGGNNLFVKKFIEFLKNNEEFLSKDYNNFWKDLDGQKDGIKLVGLLLSKGSNKVASKRKM